MKRNKEEVIKNVQKLIDKEKIPIKIMTKERLKIDYGTPSGHYEAIIRKKDVKDFNKDWWGCLGENGELVGDWREVKKIKDECERVFMLIDAEIKKENSYIFLETSNIFGKM